MLDSRPRSAISSRMSWGESFNVNQAWIPHWQGEGWAQGW